MQRIQSVSDVKTNNLLQVMNYILEKGSTSPTEIQHKMLLSWGSVSNGINELLERNILVSKKMESKGRRGKKGKELFVNEEDNFLIGLSLLRSGLTGVVMTLSMKNLYTIHTTLEEDTKESFLNKVFSSIHTLLTWIQERGSNCLAIGLAVQGIVDSKKGISSGISGFQDGEWKDVPLAEIVGKKFSLPVFIEHDPQCDLTYECYMHHYDDAVLVNLDLGIALAIVQNHKVLSGKNKYQIGYMMVENEKDGQMPMEYYCCLYWMSRRAKVTPEEFLSHPEKYQQYYLDLSHYLALTLVNIHSLFRNEKFILNGPLVTHQDFFFPNLLKEMNTLQPKENYTSSQFILTPKENKAEGAAILARQKVLWSFLESPKEEVKN